MNETIYKFKNLLNNEIDKISAKNDISPSELCNMEKAFCILEKISLIEAMDKYDYEGGNSFTRGRSSITGRYMSRDNDPYFSRSNDAYMYPNTTHHQSYNGGYSGHSVKDRMIAQLEHMMDSTDSEYEKQTIADQIHEIKSKK